MSLNANQTTLTRISLAVFSRAPDLSTLKHWIQQLDAGRSLESLTAELWNSAAIRQRYPASTTDQEFIVAAYKNIFNLTPDAPGEAYWVAQLAGGASRSSLIVEVLKAGLGTPDGTPGKAYAASRVEATDYAVTRQLDIDHELAPGLLASIMANVTEDRTTVTAAINRIDLASANPMSANQEAVCRIYLALFNRAPELEGLQYWTAQLDAGQSVNALVNQIYKSPGAQALFPAGLTDEAFVRQAYTDLFNRSTPADVEVQYWTQSLATQSRASVRLAMVDAGCDVPDGTPGKALVTNRSDAAEHAAAAQLFEARALTAAQLNAVMAQINDDPSTVAVVNSLVDTALRPVVVVSVLPPHNDAVMPAVTPPLPAQEVVADTQITLEPIVIASLHNPDGRVYAGSATIQIHGLLSISTASQGAGVSHASQLVTYAASVTESLTLTARVLGSTVDQTLTIVSAGLRLLLGPDAGINDKAYDSTSNETTFIQLIGQKSEPIDVV